MIFDLSTLHLGDVLMAMPAMRAGDAVLARPAHRVPGLRVNWVDTGTGRYPAPARGRHCTEAWLESSGRRPIRHRLLPPAKRDTLVIAPDVVAPFKQWHGWQELISALPGAVVVLASIARDQWMDALNRAHTVVCPDTGTAHMADALGCPRVVALHGNSGNWPRCAPYWNRSHCIARASMADIAVQDVLEAINV